MWEEFFRGARPSPRPFEAPLSAQGIINGDCTRVLPTLASSSVDLIVTDPPYLVNFRPRDGRPYANDDNDRWLAPAFKEMYRVLKPDTFCVSFYGWWKVDRFMQAWNAAGFRPVGHIVFLKPYRSNESYLRYFHEQAYLLVKGRPRAREVLNDVLEWGEYPGNLLHPTQKPVHALRPLIRAFSDPGQLVLDPFAGSGSTLEAAKMEGRRYLGIELEREYTMNALRRLGSVHQ